MKHPFITHVEPRDYHAAMQPMRGFFLQKGFIEAATQHRLSILAACEDVFSIQTYEYAGQIWPMIQTGQAWLEHEILSDPSVPGFICTTTSYRHEKNPIPNRHDLAFKLQEFEFPGELEDLEKVEREFLEHLGFGKAESFPTVEYTDAAEKYGVKILEAEHEKKLAEELGPVVFLKNFPEYTSPYFNMKRWSDRPAAKKIDVLLHGVETIGSAERSCDKEQMYRDFHAISDGQYAGILYEKFGKERVAAELDEFLNYNFFPRVGGGIGVTRMIRAMKLSGLI